MAWYHWMMAVAFALAFVASWNTPRAPLWVGLLACSYVLSVFYVDVVPAQWQIVPTQFVGFILDALVMICLQTFHKDSWEFWGIGSIMAFMLTADLLQLSGALIGYPPPFSGNDFGVILEILNLLALAFIGGVGLMDRMHDEAGILDRHRVDYLSRVSAVAHSKTDKPQPLRKW